MLNESRKWLWSFLILYMLQMIQTAAARGLEFTMGVDEVNTTYGKLTITTKFGDETPVEHKIELSGKLVFEDSSVDMAHFIAAYPDKKTARLALLKLVTGGNACPAFYRVVEIRGDADVAVSDEFGNCSDLIEVAYKKDSLYISMPSISGNGKDIWRYSNGVLVELTKPKETESTVKKKSPYFSEDKKQTIAGIFSLTEQGFVQPPIRTAKKVKAMINEKVVFEENGYGGVTIVGVYPDTKNARIILLQIFKIEEDCPGMYKIMEVNEGGIAHVTEDFGNCNDTPAHGIIYEGGRLIVPIPPYLGRVPGEDWIYENGNLTMKKWEMRKKKKINRAQ